MPYSCWYFLILLTLFKYFAYWKKDYRKVYAATLLLDVHKLIILKYSLINKMLINNIS